MRMPIRSEYRLLVIMRWPVHPLLVQMLLQFGYTAKALVGRASTLFRSDWCWGSTHKEEDISSAMHFEALALTSLRDERQGLSRDCPFSHLFVELQSGEWVMVPQHFS